MGAVVNYYNALFSPNDDVSNSHDRLGFAFCVALALHAAFILGVSFSRQERTAPAPKLEITLAQHRSQEAPDEADFLAQSNQQGSGTLENKALITSRDVADFQDNAIREVQQQQQANNSKPQQALQATINSLQSDRKIEQQQQQEQKIEQQNPADGDDMTIQKRSMEIASLEARLDIQQYAYARRPRIRRLTSVATKQSDDAMYLHNWRSKVEAIGNQHYPSQAKL
ncbi:MAG: protein TonB, partial [Oceanicoccus sp.]